MCAESAQGAQKLNTHRRARRAVLHCYEMMFSLVGPNFEICLLHAFLAQAFCRNNFWCWKIEQWAQKSDFEREPCVRNQEEGQMGIAG